MPTIGPNTSIWQPIRYGAGGGSSTFARLWKFHGDGTEIVHTAPSTYPDDTSWAYGFVVQHDPDATGDHTLMRLDSDTGSGAQLEVQARTFGRMNFNMPGGSATNMVETIDSGEPYIFQVVYHDATGAEGRFRKLSEPENWTSITFGDTYGGGANKRDTMRIGSRMGGAVSGTSGLGAVWFLDDANITFADLPEGPGAPSGFDPQIALMGDASGANYGLNSGSYTDFTMIGYGVDEMPGIEKLAWRKPYIIDDADRNGLWQDLAAPVAPRATELIYRT